MSSDYQNLKEFIASRPSYEKIAISFSCGRKIKADEKLKLQKGTKNNGNDML
jgi:hypothetical protein